MHSRGLWLLLRTNYIHVFLSRSDFCGRKTPLHAQTQWNADILKVTARTEMRQPAWNWGLKSKVWLPFGLPRDTAADGIQT